MTDKARDGDREKSGEREAAGESETERESQREEQRQQAERDRVRERGSETARARDRDSRVKQVTIFHERGNLCTTHRELSSVKAQNRKLYKKKVRC